MRSVEKLGKFCGGIAAVVLLMQLANSGLEAAGSVPDLEGCAFLAGSLPALAVIYFAISVLTGYRLSRFLVLRCEQGIRYSTASCAVGAAVYLLNGILVTMSREGAHVAASVWSWALTYLFFCIAGGRLGAVLGTGAHLSPVLRDSGG